MSATEKALAAAQVEVVAKVTRRRCLVEYKGKILREADACKTLCRRLQAPAGRARVWQQAPAGSGQGRARVGEWALPPKFDQRPPGSAGLPLAGRCSCRLRSDIQHAVLPTLLPLPEFYEELVKTQQVLNTKHLRAKQLWGMTKKVTSLLARGQTNFFKMLFKFNSVYNPKLQLADQAQAVRYDMSLPPAPQATVDAKALYVHRGQGRRGREIDNSTEQFVEETRMGVAD